jgi:hypothetical protein
MICFLVIYWIAIDQYFVLATELDVFHDGPGDAPPWYFIRHQFVDGVCKGVALLITLLLALMVVRWVPESSLTLAMFGLIWLGGEVWQSVVIMMNCQNLMDPVQATTRWKTFDDFLYDPIYRYPPFILLFIWVGLFYLCGPITRRLDYRRRGIVAPA